jgi:hypothetical protein
LCVFVRRFIVATGWFPLAKTADIAADKDIRLAGGDGARRYGRHADIRRVAVKKTAALSATRLVHCHGRPSADLHQQRPKLNLGPPRMMLERHAQR